MNNDYGIIGLGIGHRITIIENFLINYFLKCYRLLSGSINNKYKMILNKLINHFKYTENLLNYSKCFLLISFILFIIKILLRYFKSEKKSIFNKKISNYLFLKNSNNKKLNLSEEKSLYIANRDLNYDQIKKYIQTHKEKLKKFNLDTNENIDDPYFKLMKYYIEYNKSYNNIKNIII